MANRNGGKQTVQKPYFNSYVVARTDIGEVNAAVSRAWYEAERKAIDALRIDRRDARFWRAISGSLARTDRHRVRAGFPTKRVRDDNIPSKRGMPFHKHLQRFKLVEKANGAFKMMILHATRGWKVYA